MSDIAYLKDDLLDIKGVSHGFFGRQGGLSTEQYESLNCGVGSGDNPENIKHNRGLIAKTLGVSPHKLIGTAQIHSPIVLQIEDNQASNYLPDADGLVTKQKGVALSVLTADCGPVLFCDPNAEIIGSCHAGWKGAVGGVTDNVISLMVANGAKRENIYAVIGPCISLENYEVGETFQKTVLDIDVKAEPFFNTPSALKAKPHFDLAGYIRARLRRSGLEHISIINECTYGNPERYFSYRYNTHHMIQGYGRQISSICLRE